MKELLLGLLALTSISAFAGESLMGKEVIFKSVFSYNTGKIIAENETGVVVAYVSGNIHGSTGTPKEKLISKDKIGVRTKCHNSICEGDYISTSNGRLSSRAEAIFDDGSILGWGYGGYVKRFSTQTVIKH